MKKRISFSSIDKDESHMDDISRNHINILKHTVWCFLLGSLFSTGILLRTLKNSRLGSLISLLSLFHFLESILTGVNHQKFSEDCKILFF